MNTQRLTATIEAALLASAKPLTIERITGLFLTDQPERDQVRDALNNLTEACEGRSIELVQVATGYRYQVRKEFADDVQRLWEERAPRYSRALLETLALVAYKQPITRAEVEDIRGVSLSSSIMKTLQEREWVRIVGHRDVPGRPGLYATTKQFLDDFGLKTLSELPPLADLRDIESIEQDLFAELAPPPVADAGTGPLAPLLVASADGDSQGVAETSLTTEDVAEVTEKEAELAIS